MNIGRVGIWSMALEAQPLSAAQEAVAELDELGFPALWIPEALGKEVMSHAALLLAATRRMVVATGIANLWARDATAMVNAQRTRLSPGGCRRRPPPGEGAPRRGRRPRRPAGAHR